MKCHALYLICAAAMLLLASCHSSKRATAEADSQPSVSVGKTSISSGKTSISSGETGNGKSSGFTAPAVQNFTAKVKVKLTMGDQNVSTNGMLRMRWNDVVQLTLVDPLLGITEVGRMELSPDNMLIIDRMNKRYVSVAYDEIPALRERGIDFTAIQAMFWSETEKLNEFSFDIPISKPVKLDLRLSDKGQSDIWEAHSNVSSKYTKVSTEQLLRSMIQLAE